MKLSNYAQANNISYMQAYRQYKRGEIEGAMKTKTGSIIIKQEEAKPVQPQIVTQSTKPQFTYAGFEPLTTYGEEKESKI